jgi:hypothetical protein
LVFWKMNKIATTAMIAAMICFFVGCQPSLAGWSGGFTIDIADPLPVWWTTLGPDDFQAE